MFSLRTVWRGYADLLLPETFVWCCSLQYPQVLRCVHRRTTFVNLKRGLPWKCLDFVCSGRGECIQPSGKLGLWTLYPRTWHYHVAQGIPTWVFTTNKTPNDSAWPLPRPSSFCVLRVASWQNNWPQEIAFWKSSCPQRPRLPVAMAGSTQLRPMLAPTSNSFLGWLLGVESTVFMSCVPETVSKTVHPKLHKSAAVVRASLKNCFRLRPLCEVVNCKWCFFESGKVYFSRHIDYSG